MSEESYVIVRGFKSRTTQKKVTI